MGYRGLIADAVLDRLSLAEREQGWNTILEHADAGATTLVAELADGSLAGFCSSIACGRDADLPDHTAEISALYVEPTHWRQGIGQALLTAALDQLQAAGSVAVILWVLASNTDAIKFYAAADFEPDGASKTEPVASVERAEGRDRRLQIRLRRELQVPRRTQ